MTKKKDERFHDMTGKRIYHKEEINPLCLKCKKLCKQKESHGIIECRMWDPIDREDEK